MPDENRNLLHQFIEREVDALRGILRTYALRLGIATPAESEQVAAELLSEVTVRALVYADRFNPSRGAMAWLLGIGLNCIRERRTRGARKEWREIPVRDLAQQSPLNDDELLDHYASIVDESALSAELEAAELLDGLPEADQKIIRLAVIHDLDAETIAHLLGITPGAARVRLHRALKRLRLERVNDAQ